MTLKSGYWPDGIGFPDLASETGFCMPQIHKNTKELFVVYLKFKFSNHVFYLATSTHGPSLTLIRAAVGNSWIHATSMQGPR